MAENHKSAALAGVTLAVGMVLAIGFLCGPWNSEVTTQDAPWSSRQNGLSEPSSQQRVLTETVRTLDGDTRMRGTPGSGVREASAMDPVVEQVGLAVRSQEAEWGAETEGMTRGQIDTMAREVNELIIAGSNEWFDAAFASGLVTVAGTGSSFKSTDWDENVVMRIKMPSSRTDGEDWQATGLIRKAVLPEAQFPDIYRLKRKLNWLKARSREMLQQEFANK
jgi:hypothetical protein